jgi:hypothetical protein
MTRWKRNEVQATVSRGARPRAASFFRHCDGSRCSRILALCSAPPLGAHLSLQPHGRSWAPSPLAAPSTRSLRSADAKTRSEDAARVERGGSLLQLAQLQTTTSLSTTCRRGSAAESRGRRIRSRAGRKLRTPFRSHERPRRCSYLSGRSWTQTAHASRWLGAGFAAHEQRVRADGFALARWRQQGGGTGCDNKQRQRPRAGLTVAARAAAAATSVQERGGEDWRSSALVSPHTRSSGAEARCCNRRGGAEQAHRSAASELEKLGWRRARRRRDGHVAASVAGRS